jgi:hypothetical protein
MHFVAIEVGFLVIWTIDFKRGFSIVDNPPRLGATKVLQSAIFLDYQDAKTELDILKNVKKKYIIFFIGPLI